MQVDVHSDSYRKLQKYAFLVQAVARFKHTGSGLGHATGRRTSSLVVGEKEEEIINSLKIKGSRKSVAEFSTADKQHPSIYKESRKFFKDVTFVSGKYQPPQNESETVIEAVYGAKWREKISHSSLHHISNGGSSTKLLD